MTESTNGPDGQATDKPVRERETSGEGIELTMSDEPTTFEPEEDPEAVEEPHNPS